MVNVTVHMVTFSDVSLKKMEIGDGVESRKEKEATAMDKLGR